jgi:hypothetical protein
MNRIFYLSILTFIVIAGTGCPNIFEPNDDVLYSNSFENSSDLDGWQGDGSFELRKDAPVMGGKRSLFIAGGCIVPHTYYDLRIFDDCNLIIRCWGKNLSNGGYVSLGLIDKDFGETSIDIIDSTWKSYQSSEKLFCPSGEIIRITMNSGGFVASSMLVDLVEVVKVK